MYRGKKVAVVVPAFNEADKIARTIRSIPGFVDVVLVVDDGSADRTGRVAARSGRTGLELITHPVNRGVGAAIATGYRRALALGADATAVMAGDAQMDPADLPRLLAPVVAGDADYAKGNRFAWPGCWRQMPRVRFLGNKVLSLLTRLACGYRTLDDAQCGYTVASRPALEAIDPDTMFARYGYPNDLLGRLARAGARVIDVPVRPLYGRQWRSGIRPWRVVLPLAFVLSRALWARLRDQLGGGRRRGRAAPHADVRVHVHDGRSSAGSQPWSRAS